jgi:uncharacterized membrane protein
MRLNMPPRLIWAVLYGLILAALVHITLIFMLPGWIDKGPFFTVQHHMPALETRLIARVREEGALLPHHDPAAAVSACWFNLENGPVRITLNIGDLVQTLVLHSRKGLAFFALTDRAALNNSLELVIMTAKQRDALLAHEETLNSEEEDATTDIRVIAPEPEGLVLVRALAAFPSQKAQAEALALSLTCKPDINFLQ